MRYLDPNDVGGEDHLAHAACRLLMALDVRYGAKVSAEKKWKELAHG